MPLGDTGEVPLGVCEEDAAAERPASRSSEGASELFRDRAPMRLFLSLNFSIQLELSTVWFSGVVVVAEKARAFSRINSFVNGSPFFSCVALSTTSPLKFDGQTYLILRPHRQCALNVG